MKGPPSSDNGFGLFEAIVALAIASLALSALYRSLGGAVRAAGTVQEHGTVLAMARSHFDSLGSDGLLQAGATSGAYGNGATWRLLVTPLSNQPVGVGPKMRPYWLSLEAFDRRRNLLLKLETAKVARAPE